MRILFWTDSFCPAIGGVETFSSRILPRLRSRGFEFTVVTGSADADAPFPYDYQGLPVHAFPFYRALAGGGIDRVAELRAKIIQLKRQVAPDVVHINALGFGVWLHLDTARSVPAPCLLTIHSALEKQALDPETIGGRAIRAADWVNACSQAVLAEARHRIPEITIHSSVIYYGIDIPTPAPGPRPSREPRILCLGRFIPDKGFDLALAAFPAILSRFPSSRLVMAGDGVVRADLERQARALKISQAVDFLGWVAPEKVPALLNSATLVLMPSRWEEPFGLVALEAAAMARPVIASRAGGLVEAIEHGRTGWLVEKNQAGALAEAIDHLLGHPEAADELGRTARRRVQDSFSWDRCADAYEKLYRGLAKEDVHAQHPSSRSTQ